MDGELDALVKDWLTLPQAAERMGVSPPQVRSLVRSGQLPGFRRGDPRELSVPAVLIGPAGPVKGLPGTLTLLRDQGYDEVESLRWLFTPDDTLPGSPAQALAENRGTEVRRRAQALGF